MVTWLIIYSTAKGNSKPLFQVLGKSTKGSNTSNITQLHNCDSDSNIAASFAASFQSVCTTDNECLPQTHKHPGRMATPQADVDIDEQGILTLLKTLNYRKGTEPASLSPALLKFLAEDTGPSLTLIFKHSIEIGYFAY